MAGRCAGKRSELSDRRASGPRENDTPVSNPDPAEPAASRSPERESPLRRRATRRGRGLVWLLFVALIASDVAHPAVAGRRAPRATERELPSQLVVLTPADLGAYTEPSNFLRIYTEFSSNTSSHVLVVAHRADWARAPENSLPAIRNCITMGVDVVEIDLRRTKDGHLVVIHDSKVDRTTNGRGHVADLTLAELRQLRLKMADGTLTDERVPTLEEALELMRDKVMINLDHAYGHMRQAIALLQRTGTFRQALFKSRRRPALVEKTLRRLQTRPEFMPIIDFRRVRWRGDPQFDVLALVAPYFEILNPKAIEIILEDGDAPILRPETVAAIRELGARVWVNAMWNHVSGGHSELNSPGAPEAAWQWLVDRGVTMIQTNEPLTLLTFLRQRELHW